MRRLELALLFTLLVAAHGASSRYTEGAHGWALPDAHATPGAIAVHETAMVCGTAWGKDARRVTEAMKVEVARRYGLPRTSIVGRSLGPCCEYDHLIPRELGGADDVKNLWPQPWAEATKKDALENAAHRAVCKGTITLAHAQARIRHDWTAFYDEMQTSK